MRKKEERVERQQLKKDIGEARKWTKNESGESQKTEQVAREGGGGKIGQLK